jgi:hypothetical protein
VSAGASPPPPVARPSPPPTAGAGRVTYSAKATFLEIYNERIYDLLDAEAGASASSSGDSLQLREHNVRGVFVEGLTEASVSTAEEAQAIVLRGMKARSVGATAMNRDSSRSHSVFTLLLEAAEKAGALTKSRTSRFHLIDLAGSERQKVTQAAGERLKEAGQINKSLSSLGGVISALVDISAGRTRHVHYRDSKLTLLLRDSLGGNSRTTLIATVSPTEDCFPETLSTLRFSKMCKMVKNKAVVNEDSTTSVAELQAEVKSLRAQAVELKGLVALQGAGGARGEGAMEVDGAGEAQAYRLCDSVLAAWDEVTSTVVGRSDGAEAGKAAATTGVAPPCIDPSTALAALAHVHGRVASLLGAGKVSVTLAVASAAYKRLQDMEEGFAGAVREREDREVVIEELQAVVARAREETAAWKAAAEQARRAAAGLSDAVERLAAGEAAFVPAVAAPVQPIVPAVIAPAAAPGKTLPGFKAAAVRRPSLAPAPIAPPPISASSRMSTSGSLLQPGFKRRASATAAVIGSAAALAVAATAKPSVPATPAVAVAAPAPAAATAPRASDLAKLIEDVKTACAAAAASSTECDALSSHAEVSHLKAQLGVLRERVASSGEEKPVVMSISTYAQLTEGYARVQAELGSLREFLEVADPAQALASARAHTTAAKQEMDKSSEAAALEMASIRNRATSEVEAVRASVAGELRTLAGRVDTEVAGRLELESSLAELQAEMEDREAEVARLSAQVTDYAAVLDAARGSAAAAGAEAAQQVALVESLTAQCAAAQRTAAEAQGQADAACAEAEGSRAREEAAYVTARTKVDDAQAETDAAEAMGAAALASAHAAAEALVAEAAALRTQVSEMQAAVESAEGVSTAMEGAREALLARAAVAEEQLDAATAAHTAAAAEQAAQLEAAQSSVTALQAEVVETRSTVAALTARLDGAQGSIAALTTQLEEAASKTANVASVPDATIEAIEVPEVRPTVDAASSPIAWPAGAGVSSKDAAFTGGVALPGFGGGLPMSTGHMGLRSRVPTAAAPDGAANPLAAILSARRAKTDASISSVSATPVLEQRPGLPPPAPSAAGRAGGMSDRLGKRGIATRDANAFAGEASPTPMTKRFNTARAALAEVGGPLPPQLQLPPAGSNTENA